MRSLSRILVWLAIALPSAARAQEVLVVEPDGASEAVVARWRARLEAALEGEPEDLAAWARAREPIATFPRERLSVLSQIEQLLVGARHARSRFHERDARQLLARAEVLASRNLDVPGMAAWYAEVQLAIAITAAQVGERELSEAALRRAASVDATRTVQPAEAHPDVVARARSIARASATGPRGRFEIRSDAPGAVAFLDDVPVGPLPATVETAVGSHVLRVDAPAHRGWASLITVFEGDRPAVEVALSPTPGLATARRAEAAALAGDLDALVGILGVIEDPPEVVRLRPGAGPQDRALLTTCRASGCRGPIELEGDTEGLEGPLAASSAEGLAWLVEPPPVVVDTTEWWEQWYVWAGVAAVVVAGVAAGIAVGVAQDQSTPPPLIVIVDPGGLPVAGVD
ncbi:MAG: PEGA domain-containing protein [Sandaracinaceae bacterium]